MDSTHSSPSTFMAINLIGGVVAVVLDKVDTEDLPEILPVAAKGHESVEVIRQ